MNNLKTYTLKLGTQISLAKPQIIREDLGIGRLFLFLQKGGAFFVSKANDLFNPATEGNPYE